MPKLLASFLLVLTVNIGGTSAQTTAASAIHPLDVNDSSHQQPIARASSANAGFFGATLVADSLSSALTLANTDHAPERIQSEFTTAFRTGVCETTDSPVPHGTSMLTSSGACDVPYPLCDGGLPYYGETCCLIVPARPPFTGRVWFCLRKVCEVGRGPGTCSSPFETVASGLCD